MLLLDLVGRASVFAAQAHKGQFRKYVNAYGLKESYINHPARVVAAVATHMGGTDDVTTAVNIQLLMAASWCHDVLEDCEVDVHTLVNATSPACARLVGELTNPSKRYVSHTRTQRKAMDRDHIRDASPDAKLIKTFDRIDNVLGLVNAPRDFALLYIRESDMLAEALTGVDKIPHGQLTDVIQLAKNYFDNH